MKGIKKLKDVIIDVTVSLVALLVLVNLALLSIITSFTFLILFSPIILVLTILYKLERWDII
tara:strand:- start:1392 stop:1577 length:186 start_codon:yes stop_codon:yes gene_type:complete